MGRHQRKVKNLLINPLVQLRLSAISVGLLLIFTASVVGIAYFSLIDLFEALIELSDVPYEVQTILANKLSEFSAWLIVFVVIYSFLTLGILIIESHKVVGAAFAINRFVKEKLIKGEYSARLKLRQGDFLQDVAQSLNELSEKLENKEKN